jgi:type IV secretion system protein TrbL
VGDLWWLVEGPLNELFTMISDFCTDSLLVAFRLMDNGQMEVKPFEGVIGVTTSIGITLAFLMTLVQIGRSMIQVGGGFGRLAIGLVEYTFAVVGGIAVLELALEATGTLANDLLATGQTDGGAGQSEGWAGLAAQVNAAQEATADPFALALAGVLFNFPAAVLYMLLFLALQFVLPLGACVIVIAAAGRLSEFGRAWLPMLARLLGTAALAPLGSALVLIIGIALQGAAANIDLGQLDTPPDTAGAEDTDDPEALLGLLLGGIIVLLSPFTFIVIYRMLGFTDRASGSGSGGSVQVSTNASSTSRFDANAGGTSGLAAAESTADRRFANAFANLARVGSGTLTGGLAAAGGTLGRAADGLTATRSRDTGGHSTRSIEPGSAGGSAGNGSAGNGSAGSGWSGIGVGDVRGSDGAAMPISIARVQELRNVPQASAPRVAEGVGSGYDHA